MALLPGIWFVENICICLTSCAADDAVEASVWTQACAWICTEAANEELLFQAMLGLTRTSGWTYAWRRGGEAVGT